MLKWKHYWILRFGSDQNKMTARQFFKKSTHMSTWTTLCSKTYTQIINEPKLIESTYSIVMLIECITLMAQTLRKGTIGYLVGNLEYGTIWVKSTTLNHLHTVVDHQTSEHMSPRGSTLYPGYQS